MIHAPFRISIGCGLVALGMLVSGCALFQKSDAPAIVEDEADFESLFNGEELGEWVPNERPENWKVEEGAIVGRGPRSHLYYMKEEFDNFEFRAQVMINEGGNSGIYFHAGHMPEGWPTVGHEGQVCNTGGDPTKTGSLWGVVRVLEIHAPDNEWFDYQIRVQGRNIQTKINGKLLVDYLEPEGIPGGRRLGKGYFALQQHDPDSVVRYRHIRVKRLLPQ